MIVTKSYINQLRVHSRLRIDEHLARYLLAKYDEEPFPHVYSEQDLYEQIRKLVYKYEKGILDISIKTPKQRLIEKYEFLKEDYMDLLSENLSLKEEVTKLKTILSKTGYIEQENPDII